MSDPFNYAMPNRSDLMSLSTIKQTDNMKTNTKQFQTGRYESSNLTTNDIQGKFINSNNCRYLYLF